MTTNQQDLRALAYLASRLRDESTGPTWHNNGITAALASFEGRPLTEVVERVTRHAADPEARTPAAVHRPFVPDAQPEKWQPTRGPWCADCGVAQSRHGGTDHEFAKPADRRPAAAMAAIVEELRQRKHPTPDDHPTTHPEPTDPRRSTT